MRSTRSAGLRNPSPIAVCESPSAALAIRPTPTILRPYCSGCRLACASTVIPPIE
ncbi:Uncharacterised protein [Mycobacteroides abscessus subsp. abscessus]|nr:Uncharacterised protein [Mycobacteroides abscessus subsp. abscessus]